MKKLNAQRIGIALGGVTAVFIGLTGLAAAFFGWGSAFVRTLGSVYLGYDVSVKGAIIGGLWGFLDGFLAGYLFSWFYNKLK